MNYYDLQDDEQLISDSFDRGEFVSVPNIDKRKLDIRRYVRGTLGKTKNINIRLSERDVYRLKARAIEEGLPYQTLASSILHKAAAR